MPKPIIIDESLFAHINTDPFLVGSVGLQGNKFANTIGYLNQYINVYEQKGGPITEDIRQLLSACTELTSYEDHIGSVRDRNDITLDPTLKDIQSKVSKLKKGEYLLVPGGWLSTGGSHAIVYEFKKHEDGSTLFIIHNSGDGLQYHAKLSDKEKELFSPTLTYKIPKKSINSEHFIPFMNELLSLQISKIHKKSKITAEYLYKTVIAKLSYLDGEIIPSDDSEDKWYTAGQQSGTCAQHSLHEMLKARFNSVDNYRKFIYRFKAHSLDEYMAQLRANNHINETKCQKQIKKAIRHQLRILNLKSTTDVDNDLFPITEKTDETKKLLGYLSELREDAPIAKRQLAAPAINTNLSIYSVAYKPIMGKLTDFLQDNIDPIIKVNGNQTLIAEISELLKRCKELEKTGQKMAIFEQLEHFFIHMPLPKPPQEISSELDQFYQGIKNEDDLMTFYNYMNELQNLYFKSCNELLHGAVIPRMYVVKFSIFAVTSHINATFNLGAERSYNNYLTSMVYAIAPATPHGAYLATDDPVLDARYEDLRNLYNKCDRYQNWDDIYLYYQSLINGFEPLKVELEKLYRDEFGAVSSPFHDVVRKCQVTSLYYFTKHFNELSLDPQFKPLIDKFNLQNQMESLYGCYTKRFSSKHGVNKFQNLVFDEQSKDTRAPKLISTCSASLQALKFSELLQENKYGVIKKPTHFALKRDITLAILDENTQRPDNETQIVPAHFAEITQPFKQHLGLKPADKALIAQLQINHQTLEDRELFHLRRTSFAQIQLTLDYFTSYLKKLSREEMQIYFEANLFQPSLLVDLLTVEKSAQFFEKFDNFIKLGLKNSAEKGFLSDNSLFFIRMAYLVNQYANKFDSERFSSRISNFNTELTGFLSCNPNPNIRTVLHKYKFLTLAEANKDTIEPLSLFVDSLTSYFSIQASDNINYHLDVDSKFQIEFAEHSYRRILKNQNAMITDEIVINLLKELGISLAGREEISVEKNYPIYQIKSRTEVLYSINLERGLIFKDNLAYRTTPVDILTHPITVKFGLNNKTSSFISADGQVILLEDPPNDVRFIQNNFDRSGNGSNVERRGYKIQKEWTNSSGTKKWYQLNPLSSAHSKFWKIVGDTVRWDVARDGQQTTEHPLASFECMAERENLIWTCLDGQSFLVSNSRNEISYTGAYRSINKLLSLMLCENTTIFHQQLKLLEDAKFINVWTDQTKTKFEINLDRYGLNLSASSTLPITLNWEGSDYQLQTDKDPLGEGVAGLFFKSADIELMILPIQPFINTGRRSDASEYYKLQQDLGAAIPHKVIEKIIGKDEPQAWQYSGTAKFMAIKMENGQPIPSTSEEALYLCYLYLGSGQTEKAWAILEYCDKKLGGMAGTYEELQYLNWIINLLPYKLEAEDANAVKITPEYVACKLKALSLFTKYSNLDKEISIPKPKLDESTVNGLFERHQIEENRSFYCQINDVIYKNITKLQALRRELPKDYELNSLELKSLLDYYYKTVPKEEGKPTAIGALGFEWVQLHLNNLRKEYDVLAVKSDLSDYENRRKLEIEGFLAEHEGVAKTRSRLEYFVINIGLPREPKLNTSLLSTEAQKILTDFTEFRLKVKEKISTPESKLKAISDLSLDITDEKFIANLGDYIKIATTAGESELKSKLRKFCKATLIASRHTSLEDQIYNLPLMCNVLYRLIDHDLPADFYKFMELVDKVKNFNPEPITVPQLYDDTKDILVKALDLWSEIPKCSVTPVPISDSDLPRVSEWLDASVLLIKKDWKAIEDRFYLEDAANVEDESSAGHKKFAAFKELQTFAVRNLNQGNIELIIRNNEAKFSQLSEEQAAAEVLIEQFANQGPNDLILKQQMAIDVASGKHNKLDLNTILTLYFHADMERYRKETGLEDDKIMVLHDLLTTFVAKGLQLNQCQKINEQLNVLPLEVSAHPEALYALAKTLFADNYVSVVINPALSLFQYYEKILLRKEQKKALDRLLNTDKGRYDETIEKIIMGGGKSKVILPTLAQKKATGSNLVIIEVPRALLRTNYIDLQASSSTLFNQHAVIFEFNRDSDCSIGRLEQLYNQLTATMVNKDYLVTTGDALQSLELKYLDLLLMRPDVEGKEEKEAQLIISTWEKQVILMERLVLLFKHRGDLIIDEVHQGLLLKSKLNYTFGEPNPIAKNILKYSIGLYQFLANVNIDDSLNLQDALINRTPLTDQNLIENALKQLVIQLINDVSSPLHQEISQWLAAHPGDNKLIYNYLLNQSDSIPEYIDTSASEDLKEKFAFYKEQISHILPFTLKRNQGEHYGPSKISTKTPAECMLAIPYMANNVPNERSRFANYLESINYTIQSTQITGITLDLFTIILDDWIKQARMELAEGTFDSIDRTSVAIGFQTVIKDPSIRLSDIDLENKNQLKALHKRLSHNKGLIFNLLETHILPLIKSNDNILHSDAYAHVDLVHSCQGMSGTPANHPTFHQRLHFSKDSSKGIDEYILQTITEKKPKIKIHGIDFTKTSEFISSLFSMYCAEDNVRTIIDINASFKGIDNIHVAFELAKYIQANKTKFAVPKDLKYVLFFNEKNELSALRVQENFENQEPILLGTSDPKIIDRRLNSSPEERFTYYDQAHTVGADIKQEPNAKGLVLIDQDTNFQSFLQGSMRMRALLEGNQSIDLIAPVKIASQSLADIAQNMQANEHRQLKQDNFNAAVAKMTNIIRNDLMQKLLAIDGPNCVNKKYEFLDKVRRYFIEMQSSNFYHRFGGMDQIKRTEEVLVQLKEALTRDWESLLDKDVDGIAVDKAKIIDELDKIISTTLIEGTCEVEQKSSKASLGMESDVQEEVQAEVEVEAFSMKEEQEELFDPERKPEEYVSWLKKSDKLNFMDIKSICKTSDAPFIPDFSPNIIASQNFYKTFQGQSKYIGMYLKPVHALMFERDGDNLKCTLLSQQEAEELYDTVRKKTDGSCWISTTQHTVLAGKPVEGFKDSENYQLMIEQIQYFNGEFNLLLQKTYDLKWLEIDSKEKLDFFARFLFPCHETTPSDFFQVSSIVSFYRKVALYIATNPWEDYSDFNWKRKFHGCSDNEVVQFKELAKIFNLLSKAFKDGSNLLTIDDIAVTFTIPITGLGIINNYIEQLKALKSFLENVERSYEVDKLSSKPLALKSDALANIAPLSKDLSRIIDRTQDTEPAEINYKFLTTLMKKIPICVDHPAIILALAPNPYITGPLIKKILERCTNNTTALYGFLANPGQAITAQHITTLIRSVINFDDQTLLQLANHRFLLEEHFKTVLQKSDNISIFNAIINRDSMTPAMIRTLIDGEELTEEKTSLILKQKEGIIHEDLFEILINKTNTDENLKLILNHQKSNLLTDKQLAVIISKTRNNELIRQVLEHSNAKVKTIEVILLDIPKYTVNPAHWEILASNQYIKEPLIGEIVKSCVNSKVILNNFLMNPSENITEGHIASLIKPEIRYEKQILLDLAAHRALPQEKYIDLLNALPSIDMFELVINRDDIALPLIHSLISAEELDEEKIRILLTQKKGLMDLELFTTLINQTSSEENLKMIFSHANNLLLKDEQLALIINKTKSSDFIQLILGHPNVKENAYFACARNENISDISIDIVLDKTNKQDTISIIMSNRKNTETIYQYMVKNQSTSKADLIHVIKNTKSAETISRVLEHNHLKQTEVDDFYIEILKNQATSKDDLARIAERAHNFKIFEAILDHELMQLSDSSTDLVLYKLINNHNFVSQLLDHKSKFLIDLLPKITKKAFDIKLVLAILKLNSDPLVLDNLKLEFLETALQHYLTNSGETDIKNNLNLKLILPLFKKLEESRSWLDDDILNNFIVSNLKEIYSINSAKEHEKFKVKIQHAISAMQSPEILAIKTIIDRLKNEKTSYVGGFFYSSGKEKARRIETAILAVPVEERGNILNGTSPAIIKVQEALAEHRNYFSRLIHGKAKYLNDGKVDTKDSASSYMDYKDIIAKEASKKKSP